MKVVISDTVHIIGNSIMETVAPQLNRNGKCLAS